MKFKTAPKTAKLEQVTWSVFLKKKTEGSKYVLKQNHVNHNLGALTTQPRFRQLNSCSAKWLPASVITYSKSHFECDCKRINRLFNNNNLRYFSCVVNVYLCSVGGLLNFARSGLSSFSGFRFWFLVFCYLYFIHGL